MTPKRSFAQSHKTHNDSTLVAHLHHYVGLSGSQSRLRLVTLLGIGGLVVRKQSGA
jgi:hypothetical protein